MNPTTTKSQLLLDFGYIDATNLADMLEVSEQHALRIMKNDMQSQLVHGVRVVTYDSAKAMKLQRKELGLDKPKAMRQDDIARHRAAILARLGMTA